MILHENRNDRLTWLVRLVVLAVGCVVLPLSVKSLWAEAPQAGLQPGDIIDTRKLREDEQRRQLRQLGALTQDSNNAETVKTQESKATSETKPAENSASGIAEKPLSADAIMHIADTYFEKGRYEDATYYYGLLQTPEAKERLRAAEDKMLKQPRAAMPDFSKPPVNVAVGDAKGDDVDERLQRLESKVEKLVELLERTAKESRPPAVATHPLQNQEAPSPLKDNPPPTSALPKDDISELTAAERKELAALRHAQLEWSHQAADLVRDVQMYEASRDRNNAAEKEYEKANAAYKNGTVSLDLMLETQRKKVEASNDFMQATARLAMLQRNNSNSPTDKRLLAFGKLNRFKNARDEALKNWREVHALYELEAKGGEPDKEAQAREQYFYFRQQVETAHSELNSIDQKLNSWNGRNYR